MNLSSSGALGLFIITGVAISCAKGEGNMAILCVLCLFVGLPLLHALVLSRMELSKWGTWAWLIAALGVLLAIFW